MFNYRVAVAALAAVLVLAVVGFAISRMPGVGGTGPTPTPIPTPTPSPAPTPAPPLTITPADVGATLSAGTYRVQGFAVPFSVTLPAGWNATEFTPNSIGLALKSNGSVNIYLAVINRMYPDPCHTA